MDQFWTFGSRAFALTAFATMWGGCSGTSSYGPTAVVSGLPTPLSLARAAHKGPPPFSHIIASDNFTGNLEIYDETTLSLVGEHNGVAGWGVAVNPKNDDVAWGTNTGTIVVAHVTLSTITPYATLTLSQKQAGYGVAFDKKGDLFAANWPTNDIDEFGAARIAAGGGTADRTIAPPDLTSAYFLAFDGKTLLADGYDAASNDIVVSVSTKSGKDKILQTIANSHGGVPGGLAFDAHHNLIVNNQDGTLQTFAKPWTGQAISTFNYGLPYGQYGAISLDYTQTQLWATDEGISGGLLQANSYPLGSAGVAVGGGQYAGVALDPQGKD